MRGEISLSFSTKPRSATVLSKNNGHFLVWVCTIAESPVQEEDFSDDDLTDSQFREFELKVKAAEKGIVAPKTSVPSPSFQNKRKINRVVGRQQSSAREGSEATTGEGSRLGSRRCRRTAQVFKDRPFPQIESPTQRTPLLQTKQANSKRGGSKSPGISSQISLLQRQILELKKLIPREGSSDTRLAAVESQVHKVSVQVNENTAELGRLKRRVNELFKKF